MPSNPVSGSTSTNIYLSSIISGGYRWSDGATPGTNISYYFSPSGVSLGGEFGTSINWFAYEKDAYKNALNAWSSVANITFTETTDVNSADLVAFEYTNYTSGTLGAHETPYSAFLTNGQAWGYFNYAGTGFTESGLQISGYGYVTLLHELGHALGLTHPHSTEGGSTIFPGVTGPYDSFGENNLNQGIYTVMSYNDGWTQFQDPVGNGLINYGYSTGPSALDIAAIQHLYGANTTIAGGDNTYYLPSANIAGTGWKAIWDTGGVDTIAHTGPQNATLNLTAATLDNSPTGGGMVNYATGIYGGYTIANSVVIENAIGGSGNDTITGNSANNLLIGNLGNDNLEGGAGNDNLYGDTGSDTLNGGADHDYLYYDTDDILIGGSGYDWALSANYYGTATNFVFSAISGIEGFQGTANNDRVDASALSTAITVYGHAGADTLIGGSADDYLYFDNQDLTSGQVLGGAGYDWAIVWDGLATTFNLQALQAEGGYGGNANDTLNATGISSSVSLIGNGGNDQFIGGSGNDYLYIDSTDTSLNGGAGYDWAIVWDNSNITLNLGVSNLEGVQSAAGNDYLNAAGVNSSVSLIGNGGNDTLIGSSFNDYLYVDHFDTSINGGAGYDWAIVWDNSNITLNLGVSNLEGVQSAAGNDYLNAAGVNSSVSLIGNGGNDTLIGSSFNDYLYVDHFDTSINGGAGYDWVISWDSFGITLDIAAAQAEGFSGIAGNDSIDGTNANWALTLYGYDGKDTLKGGSNNDYLHGGNGDDVINGAAGFDIAIFNDVIANYTITQVNATTYTINGNGFTDTLYNIEQAQFSDTTYVLAL